MNNPDPTVQSSAVPPEFCQICGMSSSEKKLVVFNDRNCIKNTHDESPRMLLCIDCFLLKSLSILCVSESEKIIAKQTETTELRQNRKKENRFRLCVYEILQKSKDKRWEENDLISSGAEVTDISPTTARRHLDKMCSSKGVLRREFDGENNFVTYNMKGLLDMLNELQNENSEDVNR